jgi:hypothetical protein
MARLRARQEQRRQQGNPGTSATLAAASHLDFVGDRVFDPPLTGIYNGQLVKVHERGNTKGMSATLWISDSRGANQIVSLGQVIMLDANYIAPTNEQLDTLLDALQVEPAGK